MMNIACILHPTDLTEYSDNAFRIACALARDHEAHLIVLHVAAAPFTSVMGPDSVVEPSGEQLEILDEMMRKYKAMGIDLEHLVEMGDEVDTILSVVRERRCDLVVMGTHGRTGVNRMLIGSVAERVMREATCPVLIAKPSHLESVGGSSRRELVAH